MIQHKLLFVDDEENIIKSLKRLFQDEKYEVLTAKDGLEALKLLDEHKFSLILSDYRMPKLDGVEFLKLSIKKNPDTIRMILTGFSDVEVAISAINEGGVYKFITKPWEEENLKVQIKRALEHYELVLEKEELLEKIKNQNEKLKELNLNLEKKVEEKTLEIKNAYEKLQLKVQELEGRDKILNSLLTINNFEDTLNLILDTILDIVNFDNIVIYISDKEQKVIYPKAGYLIKNGKRLKLGSMITNFLNIPIQKLSSNDSILMVDEYQINRVEDYSYLIPIKKSEIRFGGEDIYLGAIFVSNSKTKQTIENDDLKIVAGYASLAALAINDYFVTTNMPDIQEKLNEILREFK